MGSNNISRGWPHHDAFDGGMGPASNTGQHTGLRQKHQSLVREHRAEREAAEELQGRLYNEMRELRDQCDEQGQMVGKLMQRLSDARAAVTSDLQSAQAVRSILGGELRTEELQRSALERTWHSEQAELVEIIQKARRQYTTMSQGNDSLKSQLRASQVGQAELRGYIAAERSGRAELKLAGEQECVACHENDGKVYGELQNSLQDSRTEQAAIDAWQSRTKQELSQLQQEISIYTNQEEAFRAEIQSARDRKMSRTSLGAHHDVDELHAQLRCIEEQRSKATDWRERYDKWCGAAQSESVHLELELQQCKKNTNHTQLELDQIDQQKAHTQETLQQLKKRGGGVGDGSGGGESRPWPPSGGGDGGSGGGSRPWPPIDRGAGVNFESDLL